MLAQLRLCPIYLAAVVRDARQRLELLEKPGWAADAVTAGLLARTPAHLGAAVLRGAGLHLKRKERG